MSAGRRISRKVLNIVYGLISGVMTLGAGHQEMIPHRRTSDISGWSLGTGHPARHPGYMKIFCYGPCLCRKLSHDVRICRDCGHWVCMEHLAKFLRKANPTQLLRTDNKLR